MIHKKNFFLFLFLCTFSPLFCQSQHLQIGGYTNNSGRNIVLNYGWNIGRSSFDVGGKFLFRNAPEKYAESNIFYRQYYPVSFDEFWGINLMYRYAFYTPTQKKMNNLYGFVNTQLTRASLQEKFLHAQTTCNCPNPIILYRMDYPLFKETIQLENTIGVGVKTTIIEPLFLHVGAGGGVALIYFDEPRTALPSKGWEIGWEFSGQFFIALEYSFQKKKNKK